MERNTCQGKIDEPSWLSQNPEKGVVSRAKASER
jgi:hypothetical protein